MNSVLFLIMVAIVVVISAAIVLVIVFCNYAFLMRTLRGASKERGFKLKMTG